MNSLVPECLLKLNTAIVGNVATDALHVGGVLTVCQIILHFTE